MKARIFFSYILASLVITAHTPAMADADIEENYNERRWEYLVVGAASNTNLQPTSNTAMRKDTSGAFGHEPFVLEQQLDKLGAKGWELVSVFGSANNPTYYFKRVRR